jgi:formylmethanofuran dehydrogenase subunit E
MVWTDDPVADFDRYDGEYAKLLSLLPVCVECGEPIQDETAFYIYDDWVCERCIHVYRRDVIVE